MVWHIQAALFVANTDTVASLGIGKKVSLIGRIQDDNLKFYNTYHLVDCFHEGRKYYGTNVNEGNKDKRDNAEACRDHCRYVHNF